LKPIVQLAAVLALLLVAVVPAAALSPPRHVSGSSIARDLRAGTTVIEAGAIDGPLDLTGTRVVSGLFRCRECTFGGRVAAPDVTFARTVDLSGSTFRRQVDFSGATFRAPALFRAAPEGNEETKGGTFLAGGDFSLAVCALLGLANSNPTLRQMVDPVLEGGLYAG
jgi:hypothetical protein